MGSSTGAGEDGDAPPPPINPPLKSWSGEAAAVHTSLTWWEPDHEGSVPYDNMAYFQSPGGTYPCIVQLIHQSDESSRLVPDLNPQRTEGMVHLVEITYQAETEAP
jgi:hypothetical protein